MDGLTSARTRGSQFQLRSLMAPMLKTMSISLALRAGLSASKAFTRVVAPSGNRPPLLRPRAAAQ